VKSLKARIVLGSLVALAAAVFGIWWWTHDPFRISGGSVVSDMTTFYRSEKGFYNAPRRMRLMILKKASVPKLWSYIKATYPRSKGWQWQLGNMPQGFAAFRDIPGDQLQEHVSGSLDSEGNVELSELRAMTPVEVQWVTKTQGSDAFVMYPDVPRPRRPSFNPRFIMAG
jgi:hypothetical protein